jgi:hypothetical protein
LISGQATTTGDERFPGTCRAAPPSTNSPMRACARAHHRHVDLHRQRMAEQRRTFVGHIDSQPLHYRDFQ